MIGKYKLNQGVALTEDEKIPERIFSHLSGI